MNQPTQASQNPQGSPTVAQSRDAARPSQILILEQTPEERIIRRENLNTQLVRWLTLSEAIEELAREQFEVRREVVLALCEGKIVTAGVWAYCWRSEGR